MTECFEIPEVRLAKGLRKGLGEESKDPCAECLHMMVSAFNTLPRSTCSFGFKHLCMCLFVYFLSPYEAGNSMRADSHGHYTSQCTWRLQISTVKLTYRQSRAKPRPG